MPRMLLRGQLRGDGGVYGVAWLGVHRGVRRTSSEIMPCVRGRGVTVTQPCCPGEMLYQLN